MIYSENIKKIILTFYNDDEKIKELLETNDPKLIEILEEHCKKDIPPEEVVACKNFKDIELLRKKAIDIIALRNIYIKLCKNYYSSDVNVKKYSK